MCSCTRTQHTQGVYPGYDIYDVAAKINVLAMFCDSTGHVQCSNRTFAFSKQDMFVLVTGHTLCKNRTLAYLQQGIFICCNRTYASDKQDINNTLTGHGHLRNRTCEVVHVPNTPRGYTQGTIFTMWPQELMCWRCFTIQQDMFNVVTGHVHCKNRTCLYC